MIMEPNCEYHWEIGPYYCIASANTLDVLVAVKKADGDIEIQRNFVLGTPLADAKLFAATYVANLMKDWALQAVEHGATVHQKAEHRGFTFTDADVLNYPPQYRTNTPRLIYRCKDHTVVTVAYSRNTYDAFTRAADAGLLKDYQVSNDAVEIMSERKFQDVLLINNGYYDVGELHCIDLPVPNNSFVALFNAASLK